MPHSEHRSHKKLQDYWESLRKGRLFPGEGAIDPDAIADIWPSCFLIAIDPVTQRLGYRYTYLGDALVGAYGYDLDHPDVTQRLLSAQDEPMMRKFDEVRRRQSPLVDESEFINRKQQNVKYRSSLLPLGEGNQVTHIIGCMRWRIF